MKTLALYLLAALLPALLPPALPAQTSEDYARKGADSYRKGDYTTAIISLNKAISLDPYLEEDLSPYLAKAYAKRAEVHAYNGNHGKAVADLEEAVRLSPESSELRRALAGAQEALRLTRGPARPVRAAPAPQAPPLGRPPVKPARTPWYVIIGLLFLIPGAGVLVWMALQLKSAEEKKKADEAEASGGFSASRGLLPGGGEGFALPPAAPPPAARPEVVLSEARALASQGKFEEARAMLARKRQPDLSDYHLFLEIYVGLCDLMRAKLTASQISDELYNKPGGKWDYRLYLSLAGVCKTPEAAGLAHQLRQMALTGMTKTLSFQEAPEEFYALADGFEKAGETDLALKVYGQFAEAGIAYKDAAERRERLKARQAAPPPPKQGQQQPPGVNVYGRTIGGRYELKGTLGEGGMGTVYEGWDQQERRQVAVKRMHSWLNEYAEEYARFKHEAEIVARLRHPNIVGVYGVVEQDGDVYLVFEYLAGKTLSGLIRERKGLSLQECKDILGGVCSAVDYAHRQNVIHRDLKPGNIMVDSAGLAKVMDFGLASELRESMTRVTHQTLAGTPLYMAPEQDQGLVKKECDIYAIGVCLYEMLAGTPPFNNKDLLKQKMYKDYKEVTTLLPWLPSGVDRVIGRALEPEPALRYENPMDFYEELKALGER